MNLRAAAIRLSDGRLLTGRSHFATVLLAGQLGLTDTDLSDAEEGFLTDAGFMGRVAVERVLGGRSSEQFAGALRNAVPAVVPAA